MLKLSLLYAYSSVWKQRMPPSVAFSPKHACSNFPICTASAFQTRNGGKRVRSLLCTTCSDSLLTCAVIGCESKCAPLKIRGEPISFCSTHYRDPSLSAVRTWKLCSNQRIGCTQLAEQRRGGKCFACNTHSLPCRNSLLGCTNYVRSAADIKPRDRPACCPHDLRRCPYDPANSSRCSTPRCNNSRVDSSQSLCNACVTGSTPCLNSCSRRAEQGYNGYCRVCSGGQSLIPSTTFVQLAVINDVVDDSISSRLTGATPSCEGAQLTLCANDTQLPFTKLTAGHAPPHACGNFPICTNHQRLNQKRNHAGLRTHLGRDIFCSMCLGNLSAGKLCKHPACGNPVAPTRCGKGPHVFCAFHLRDPAHESIRSWQRCAHFWTAGCLHLSLRPNSGKCYACENNFVPCANASKGCAKHVRLNPRERKRRECSGRCIFYSASLVNFSLYMKLYRF